MERLPNEKITKKQLIELLFGTPTNNLGSEGKVILSKDGLIARKLFHEAGRGLSISKNKLDKLSLLYRTDLNQDINILKTISCEGELVGYDTISNYPHQKIMTTDKKTLIKYLKQTRNLLEHFHTKKIVFGDVKPNNILLGTPSDICSFCDLDNIQINDYPIDKVNISIADFLEDNYLLDKRADIYMHNLLLLKILFYEGEDYDYIVNLIQFSKERIEKHFTKSAEEDIICMQDCFLGYNGGYLIDKIDESKLK